MPLSRVLTALRPVTTRLRRIAGALVLALAFAAQTSSAAAQTEFRGGGIVFGFTNCEAFGWSGVDTVLARFRPSGLNGNGNIARLSVFWDLLAMHLRSRGGNFTGTFAQVEGAAIGSGLDYFDLVNNIRNIPEIRITRQIPATIAQTTGSVRLEGRIRHFSGLRGCLARFQLTMRRN